jgi:hypothetical protein
LGYFRTGFSSLLGCRGGAELGWGGDASGVAAPRKKSAEKLIF